MSKCRRNPGPLTLRISVTERCQLRCAYCRPTDGGTGCGRGSCGDELSFGAIVRLVRVVQSRFGLAGVRLTGGEPLLRPRLAALVEMLAAEGVQDIALTTNGQLLHEMAPELARAGLRRVNVSLDSLHPSAFERLTRGGELHRTLRGIHAALDCGLQPVKTNTVLLRGINDGEVLDLVRLGLANNCQVRFLELMPIGVAQAHFEQWFVPASEAFDRIAAEFHVGTGPRACPTQPHGTSRNYAVRDASGRSTIAGFIAPCSQPFCEGCRRLRLTASGRLLGCLAQRHGHDVRPLLESAECNDDAIAAAISNALLLKQHERRFQQQDAMAAIGG